MVGNRRIALFILALAMVLGACGCSFQKSGSKVDSALSKEDRAAGKNGSLGKASVDKTPLRVDYLFPAHAIDRPELYVYKEKRRLFVIQSNVLVRDYPVGLGFSPRGDKERQGDGRTPEGEFFVCVKNASSRFVKSLGLSYPDRKHAERALFAGLIGASEYRGIVAALDGRSAPPWNTRLGGSIFIHAGGAHRDWTDGCIALYDSDMEELFIVAGVGTQVHVRP